MRKEDCWWAKIFGGGDADPDKYLYVQYNVAVATLASEGWAIKMHWMQRKKTKNVFMLYRQGNADFSHPIWLCRFCRCWSTQYGRLQGAATISCRRSDSCHSTSTVHERHTTLLHNIAQVGLLRKHRIPQVPIRNILSTPLGVSFILFFCQPTRQVQNSINIPSLQQVWVSPQQFQLSSADWLYLIRLASPRELKNHLGQHQFCSYVCQVPGLDTTPYTVAPFQ